VTEFRCPACGFRVFNRRCPDCEGCGKPLPAELLLSAEDVAQREQSDERAIAESRKKGLDIRPDGVGQGSSLGNVLDVVGQFIA